MTENEWVFLLEVFDRLQAEIFKEALEAQGIPAQLFQEGAAHYVYPVGGPLGKIELCVPSMRLKEAQEWLEAYDRGNLESDNSETEIGEPEENEDTH